MAPTTTLDIPPFRPAPGLANPHVQTIAGKLLRPKLELPLWRERLETPDGDFLDLDFAFDPAAGSTGEPGAFPEDPTSPVAVLLHGLEGSARRRYMKHTYRALLAHGLRPVGLNFRGCSGEPNRTARAYHSGETSDLRLVLDHLAGRWPDAPRAVLGYSLGGNVALKLLGEEGRTGDGRVAAGAAVSVPFDLAAGAEALERSWLGRTIYTRYFMRTLVPKTLARADLLGDRIDLDAVRGARTIRGFDDALTAPLHGFDGAADYYARSSSRRFLADIDVPTLVVHSCDDPFLPASAIPETELTANPAITPLITGTGGHQGYVGGSILQPDFWVERVVAGWLGDVLRKG
ncbi:MAG: alpha/beta hydrolase [Longimicrobiales bacterium]